jgi:hypothetical protein
MGWRTQCTWEGYRDGTDRTLFIMRTTSHAAIVRHALIAPMEDSRVVLLDAPSAVHDRFAAIVRSHWAKGVKRKGVHM